VNSPAPDLGKVGGALRFHDTTNSSLIEVVQVPNDPALNFGTGNFSIDAWVYWDIPVGPGFGVVLLAKLDSFRLMAGEAGLGMHVHLGAADTDFIASSDPIPFKQWVHVAATVEQTVSPATATAKYYINGVLKGTRTRNVLYDLTGPNDLTIGGKQGDTSSIFVGMIDELELFNRALTAGEILDIYQAGASGKCKPAVVTGLKFNDTDCSGSRSSGEPALQSWGIVLDNLVQQTSRLALTDAQGNFGFFGLSPGVPYRLSELQQVGWKQTLPASQLGYSLTFNPGQVAVGKDFGNGSPLCPPVLGPPGSPASIPTLSEWGLIALTLLLSSIGIILIRRRV